jgi:hypothetical protein
VHDLGIGRRAEDLRDALRPQASNPAEVGGDSAALMELVRARMIAGLAAMRGPRAMRPA